MSLFIGSLSFDDALHLNEVRFGVLSGSAISAEPGFLLLRPAPSAAEMEAKHQEPKATAQKTAAAALETRPTHAGGRVLQRNRSTPTARASDAWGKPPPAASARIHAVPVFVGANVTQVRCGDL